MARANSQRSIGRQDASAEPARSVEPSRRRRWTALVLLACAFVIPAPAAARADGGAAPTSNSALAVPDSARPLGLPNAVRPNATRTQTGAAPTGSSAASLTRTGFSLVAVVGLIVLIGLGVRRFASRRGGLMAAFSAGGRAPSGVLEVLGRFPVARGQTLVLLKLDRRVLLLAQTRGVRGGTAISTLCEIADPADVASLLVKTQSEADAVRTRRFNDLLRREDRTVSAALDDEPPADSAPSVQTLGVDRVELSGATPTKPGPVRGFSSGGARASERSGAQVADSIRERLAQMRNMPGRRGGRGA